MVYHTDKILYENINDMVNNSWGPDYQFDYENRYSIIIFTIDFCLAVEHNQNTLFANWLGGIHNIMVFNHTDS